MAAMECPICGAGTFHDRGERPHALCGGCHADERSRILWMMLACHDRLRPGLRVLHLAPEPSLHPRFRALFGDGYEPADVDPALYPEVAGIRKLDLVTDASALPTGAYDLVLHSHVMEHVPCNVTAVLFHLHRALKPDGMQVCCVPIVRRRHYAEDLGPLSREEATERFGQDDHVRIFGGLGIKRTLGMVFRLPDPYDLRAWFSEEELRHRAIPEAAWTFWSPHAVLPLAKDDLLLRN